MADSFTDCQNRVGNDKYKFLDFPDHTIVLDEIPRYLSSLISTLPLADLQASSLSNAQDSVFATHFLASNHIPPNGLSEILWAIAGFLRV